MTAMKRTNPASQLWHTRGFADINSDKVENSDESYGSKHHNL